MNANFTSSELPEMIDLFLDGELSSQDTDVLFHSLAGNSELQNSFQQSVNLLRSAISDSRRVSVPPPNINHIFSKAGISASAPAISTTVQSATYFSKFAPLTVAAGVSSILTFIITFMLMNGSNTSSLLQNSLQFTSGSSINSHSVDSTLSIAAFPPNSISGGNSPHNYFNSIQAHPNISEPKNEPLYSSNQIFQEEPEYISQPVSTVSLTSKSIPVEISEKSMNELTPPILPESSEDLGLVLQLRGIGGIGIGDEAPVLPKKTSTSSNVGITGYFRLNEKEMIGIELGQEDLPDLHLGNISSRYTAVTFAALCYRFSIKQYSETGTIKPFGQISFGGTQLGALGRISLGLEWQPIPMVGFNVGTEFSAMTYRYNDQFQLAKKIGIYTGVSVGF